MYFTGISERLESTATSSSTGTMQPKRFALDRTKLFKRFILTSFI